MLNTIKTIILFVIMLSSIALVHELGHLLVAKFFGVYCSEFSIGMGPKICSKKYKETEYSIRAFLIGGYVAMAGDGDENEDSDVPFERTLKGIAKWKQLLVMFAGIFMNFVLALVIYSLLLLNIGQYTIANKPIIESIQTDMPAFSSGLKDGDIVEKIVLDNGMSVEPESYTELSTFLMAYYDGNGPWHVTVDRNNEKYTYDIMPTYYETEDRYIIGITFSNVAVDVVDINFFNCFKYGFIYMIEIVKMLITSLSALIRGIGLKNMSGPIGVYQIVEESIEYGFSYYIELLALISLNAAVFNAIPVPAFDGGRALMLFIEVIIGKPIPKKVETFVLTASMVLIFTLMFLVSYNDIVKIIGG